MSIVAVTILVLTWLWFMFTGVLLARWDFREHRLPNRLVFAALAGGLSGFALASLVQRSWIPFSHALLGGALSGLLFLIIHIIGGMGMGDVKYSLVTGVYLGWLGWEFLWWGTFASFVLATCAVVFSVIRRQRMREIPFGPFMTVGVLLTGAVAASY